MSSPFYNVKLWRLMALVSMLALGLAFLRHVLASWGTSEVATIAPIILLATNILAWFQRSRWQVFWVGFGLFGWAYLTISQGSQLAEHLPTSRLLDDLHDRLHSTQAIPMFGDDLDGVISMQVHGDRFRRAGHSVISLVVALLGGAGASVLFPATGEDRAEPQPPEGSLLKPEWRDVMSHRS